MLSRLLHNRLLTFLARPAALAGAVMLAGVSDVAAGDWSETEIGGRRMIVYTPERLEGYNAPMIISLHGAFGTAEAFSKVFPVYELADRYQFRIAYVDGTPIDRVAEHRNWNAGDCCGEAVSRQVDDITFLDMVLGRAVGANMTFPENAFLFGHSNGAMMAYRYACTHPDRIRGVIAVAGTLSAETCENADGVNILAIHGDLDQIIPFDGGPGRTYTTYDHRSVAETLEALTSAGAEAELIRVHDAGNNLADIDRRMSREFGYSVPEAVVDFIEAHKLR